MGSERHADWRQHAAHRLRSHWVAKVVGVAVSITVFMVIYFVLLEHPQFPVTIMALQPLDRAIAFTPWALIPYASLWVYISLVPNLLDVRTELLPYLGSVATVAVIGCMVFLFWPTEVPNFGIDYTTYPFVAFLKHADDVGNACPSLHVAFAVLTVIWLARLLCRMTAPVALHIVSVVWCALIIWSTMALKQHVALDVETGALLGGAAAGLHWWLWPQPALRQGAPTVRRG